jgi:hypothetical protein
MAKVYWASRDLSSFFIGNHQFILIMLDSNESLLKTTSNTEGTQKFAILAGHQPHGDLIFVPNQTDDVKSVREALTPSSRGWFSDLDMEKHLITSSSGGGITFAQKLETLAYNYQANTKTSPVKYDLWDRNCATWVNTLLKVAGVAKNDRIKAGEFKGVDWGEEDLIDEKLFQ